MLSDDINDHNTDGQVIDCIDNNKQQATCCLLNT